MLKKYDFFEKYHHLKTRTLTRNKIDNVRIFIYNLIIRKKIVTQKGNKNGVFTVTSV